MTSFTKLKKGWIVSVRTLNVWGGLPSRQAITANTLLHKLRGKYISRGIASYCSLATTASLPTEVSTRDVKFLHRLNNLHRSEERNLGGIFFSSFELHKSRYESLGNRLQLVLSHELYVCLFLCCVGFSL